MLLIIPLILLKQCQTKICVSTVLCDAKMVDVMKQGTTAKTAAPFPVLPHGSRLLEAWKGIEDHGLVLKTTP
jgi:hypothetical protein